MSVHSINKRRQQRQKTMTPHELEEAKQAFLRGVVVDHLDGVVGQDVIERIAAEEYAADGTQWGIQ
jgi:hypothetical protein